MSHYLVARVSNCCVFFWTPQATIQAHFLLLWFNQISVTIYVAPQYVAQNYLKNPLSLSLSLSKHIHIHLVTAFPFTSCSKLCFD